MDDNDCLDCDDDVHHDDDDVHNHDGDHNNNGDDNDNEKTTMTSNLVKLGTAEARAKGLRPIKGLLDMDRCVTLKFGNSE